MKGVIQERIMHVCKAEAYVDFHIRFADLKFPLSDVRSVPRSQLTPVEEAELELSKLDL